MSELQRYFLGWKRPAVHSAVDYLIQRFESRGMVDLTDVVVVTPTKRAGRRIRELLIEQTSTQSYGFFPPQTSTVSALPELLYQRQRPFASALIQQFAWVEALQKTPRKILRNVLPQSPEDDSDPRWMELASLLQRQHLELADNRLNFADVAHTGKSIDGFTDFERWNSLAAVQRRYLDVLDDLHLWDRPTARNFAAEHNECQVDRQIVLVGAVDLSRCLRDMLRQVADQVTSLVFADASWAVRFDAFGGVNPQDWHTSSLDVGDHQIVISDGPSNQADAVVHVLDSLEGRYAADEITIGVPDTSLVPHLENKLRQFHIDVRWGPGKLLTGSPPAQWLRIVADFLSADRYAPFSELMRHKDTSLYLHGLEYRRDEVKELDRYFNNHLPDTIRHQENAPLPDAAYLVLDLLKPLRGAPRHPSEWCVEIQDVLSRLYDRRQLSADRKGDRATVAACEQLLQAILRFAQLPDSITPKVTCSVALLMLLSQIDEEESAEPMSPDAIEMVGWLDLPLDDAKVAIVTNMNDGVVPKSVSSDVFLPNRLREALEIDDNARRYARDAYAVETLLRSKMAVRFIVGRRAATNDPLRPSRLLMALPRAKLARRCLRLFSGPADSVPLTMPVERDDFQFHVPRPTDLESPIDTLSVSDFANYLVCPYRFYLRKVLGIRPMDDRLTELDAATFGTLAHAILEKFGTSEVADSADAAEIALYLLENLSSLAKDRFGTDPQPTVSVQLAQLRVRLNAFAEKQAEWRSGGWQIVCTELIEDDGELVVDDRPVRLRGRIDRIDRRVIDGQEQFAVLDYKTGEVGESPKKKHLRGHRPGERVLPEHWVDLQLPLYRYLLTSVAGLEAGIDAKVIRLGYIALPSVASDTRFDLVDWSEETLKSADHAAADIVRRIRHEVFWPPTDPYPFRQFDDFAAIVQQGVFGRDEFSSEGAHVA